MIYLSQNEGLTPQDAVKACFQAAFGAEHMLTDIEKARDYFNREFEACNFPAPLVTPLADDVCRINLYAWKILGLPKERLFDLFVESAKIKREKPVRDFEIYLNQVEADAGKYPFSLQEWRVYIINYKSKCEGSYEAVHHSEAYRQRFHPSYRVISGYIARIFVG